MTQRVWRVVALGQQGSAEKTLIPAAHQHKFACVISFRLREVSMRRLPIAITAAGFLWAPAAQAALGNGVESFDGTIQDTNAWTAAPATAAVAQGDSRTVSFGSYTEPF